MMKTLTHKLLTLSFSITLLCGLAPAAPVAHAQTIEDFSALPETMITPPDQTPNILFVVDSSGSMRLDSNDDHAGAHDADSRSYKVRQVLRELLDDNIGQISVGLMTFGNTGSTPVRWNDNLQPVDWPVDNCNGYTGCPTTTNIGQRILTGKGYLVENVAALDAAQNTKMQALLATEPQFPTFGLDTRFNALDGDDFIAGFNSYFPDPANNLLFKGTADAGGVFSNNTIISAGGTPLRGSLQSANTYIFDSASLAANEVDASVGTVVPPFVDATLDAQCLPNTFVFLITDGFPTVSDTGGSLDTSGNGAIEFAETETEVENVRDEAITLYDGGVETWVFGFALPDTDGNNNGVEDGTEFMNTIAAGGSNSTRNAFLSSSAAQLKSDIEAAIESVKTNAGSSSGISVVASSAEGAGSVVQAIFNPQLDIDTGVPNPLKPTENLIDSVYWNATLSAFFVDDFGYLREDDGDATLEGYGTDTAFRLSFNEVTEEVEVFRIVPSNLGTENFSETETGPFALSDLEPIWEAGDLLSSYDQSLLPVTDPNYVNLYGQLQRPYDVPASNSDGHRHIVSWLQTNPRNNQFETGALLDFIYDESGSNSINSENFLMLAPNGADLAAKKLEAEKIVRFIRGEEGIAGLRSRTANGNAYLLGDIVHSTAAQVDKPNQNFDSQGDDSYRAFKQHWEDQDRRRMVYVGANDGMLHAFNGGFWDGENKTFTEASAKLDGEAEHELGAEIWAYVPMNVLPHLQFLTSTAYKSNQHVAFVDGAVQSFDVRIFDEDDDHINGWGTILVVGMRLGGGAFDVDYNANNANNPLYTTRSAYVVLDVTNPEVPPIPLGEISHGLLGFTTGLPTISRENCNAQRECDWFLVFGSGPTELATATSTRRQRLYRYKLDQGSSAFETNQNNAGNPRVHLPFGSGNSFVGDIVAQDWNNDYSQDAIYFGSIGGSETAGTGGVYRFDTTNKAVNLLFNTGKPVPYRPLLKRFSRKDWVFFGTGRYFTINDVEDNTEQNKFYGMYEPRDSNGDLTYATINTNQLIDVSDFDVTEDGEIPAAGNDDNGETFTFDSFRSEILSGTYAGWFKELPAPEAANGPSRKVSATALSFRNFLFYTDFLPAVEDDNLCSGDFGFSFLNVLDLTTGTAPYREGFEGALGTEDGVFTTRTLVGAGFAYQSYLFIAPDKETGKNSILIKTPLSTGQIQDTPIALPPGKSGRTSWRELEIR